MENLFICPIFSYFRNLIENKIERNNNTFSYYEQNNLIKNLNRINTVNGINNSNIDKLNQMTIIYDIDINKNSRNYLAPNLLRIILIIVLYYRWTA